MSEFQAPLSKIPVPLMKVLEWEIRNYTNNIQNPYGNPAGTESNDTKKRSYRSECIMRNLNLRK